jgi:thiol-disulfide isomerase/thioredoxin
MIQVTLNILLQAAAITAGGHDYATAYREANETGKPLVVLVGADWCPGCRQMKYSAIPELEKKGGLNNVNYVYLNSDEDSALAGKLMKGGSIPQLIMYHKTDEGWKRQQLTGAQAVSEIERFIERGVDAAVPKISSRQ